MNAVQLFHLEKRFQRNDFLKAPNDPDIHEQEEWMETSDHNSKHRHVRRGR